MVWRFFRILLMLYHNAQILVAACGDSWQALIDGAPLRSRQGRRHVRLFLTAARAIKAAQGEVRVRKAVEREIAAAA